jgi:hypothetical protein
VRALLDSGPMSRPNEPDAQVGAPARAAATDVTLIDAMLALSPEERLRQNDRMIRTIEELRNGFAAVRPHDAASQAGGQRD